MGYPRIWYGVAIMFFATGALGIGGKIMQLGFLGVWGAERWLADPVASFAYQAMLWLSMCSLLVNNVVNIVVGRRSVPRG